jgi:hypothetical protein
VSNVYVQKFQLSTAIDYGQSAVNPNTSKVILKFDPRKTAMSGIRPSDIRKFINSRIRVFMANGDIDIQGVYNVDDFSYSFSTIGLQNISIDALKTQLNSDSKIKFQYLLQAQNRVVRSEDINGTKYTLRLNRNSILAYGFALPTLALSVTSYISKGQDRQISSVASQEMPEIYIYGLTPDDEIWLNAQLNEFVLQSDALQELSVRWYYSAEGRNLAKVMAHYGVDAMYTRGDNIVDIYRILGEESTRTILLEEITANVDSKINPAHIELLADSLTYRTPGDKPLAQNHHGMTKRGSDWLSRMWESTTDVAMEAGLGQVDNLQSFPAKIMMGTLSRSGRMTDAEREDAFQNPAFRLDFPPKQQVKPQIVAVATAEAPVTKAKTYVPLQPGSVILKDVSSRRLPPKKGIASVPSGGGAIFITPTGPSFATRASLFQVPGATSILQNPTNP